MWIMVIFPKITFSLTIVKIVDSNQKYSNAFLTNYNLIGIYIF